MTPTSDRSQATRILLLFLGQMITSTAVILIKINTIHPVLFASIRVLGAGALLSPLFVREARRIHGGISFAAVRPAIVPGIFLAIHFMSWTLAARTTIAANANLIVNMVPLFMPIVVFVLLRERLRRFEAIGTLVALVGFGALALPNVRGSSETLLGDALAFGSMLFFTVYLALARRNRGAGNVWLYVTPLYLMAGMISLVVSFFFTSPWAEPWSATNILSLAGIILGPTIIGHTAINHAMSRLPTQLVGLSQLSQTIWAGLLGFFLLGEVPAPEFAIAAVCIVAGVTVIVAGHSRRTPRDA